MAKQLERVGKYEIVEMLARGGMGAVYKAKHPTLKRYVILKQLTLRGGSGFIQRFKREASLMIDFRNDHIVQVYDHFKEGSSYYIAMEYVDGIGLDKLIEEKGRLSGSAAILIFLEICQGLRYAHDKNVIHRDIKPANILISRGGEVKLVDFGIATSKESDEDGLTKAGMTLGTPAYMSPEQIADTRKVDRRADIYSLGVVLYEMLTGQKPFTGGFTAESINRINRGMYTRPQRINPSIPTVLRRIVRKAMHHRVSKRFRSTDQIIGRLSRLTRRFRDQDAINAVIKRYVSGEEFTLPSRRVGKTRKLGLKIVIGAVALAALAGGGLFFFEKGYYYEYLRKNQYGAVEVRAAIPKGYYKDMSRLYAYCSFKPVNADGAEGRSVEGVSLTPGTAGIMGALRPVVSLFGPGTKSANVRRVLSSGVLYLPKGQYRLELFVEDMLFDKIFYLNPRSVQKENVKSYDRQVLSFSLLQSGPKPIEIIPRVYDSATGQSLYRQANIQLSSKQTGGWIDWKEYRNNPRLRQYLAGILNSGESYLLRFEAPLYYPETVKFFVADDLDSVRIEAGLVKKPGTLVVQSDYPGLKLLVDGRQAGYLGQKNKELVSYGATTVGKKTFLFPEGSYLLTVMKDKKRVENYQFEIVPDQTTRLTVSYNAGNKKITVVTK